MRKANSFEKTLMLGKIEGNVMIPNKDTLGYLTLWLWKNKQRNP